LRRARGTSFPPDEEGLEFDSFETAKREAAAAAAEIRRDRLPKADAREIAVEVRNGHHQRVLTVTVVRTIHRVDPEPLPPRVRRKTTNFREDA
jgi:hypothetical protein